VSVDEHEQVSVSGTLIEASAVDQLRSLANQVGIEVSDRMLQRFAGGQLLVASSIDTG
jgi:hypothetical protein